MATEVRTRPGGCATHGHVEATKEVPQPSFPFLIYAVRRVIADRRPFRCPICGAAVQTG
jgi:hypothetical protein